MKVLVTGAAGLIGSHLCDMLLESGHTVFGVDDLSFGNLKNLENARLTSIHFEFIQKDLTKKSTLKNFKSIDVVYHLASYKKAPKGTIDSSKVMSMNYHMTENVLDFCQTKKAKLIYASTSDVYGNNSSYFDEGESIQIGPPTNERYSYALSKFYDEQVILNLVNEQKLQATIARIFGCISERSNKSWSGGHIPLFIDSALKNKPIYIHGTGRQTRSICHAWDVVEGLYKMIDKDLDGEIINIGGREEMSVENVARMIVELCQSKSEIIYIPSQEIYGDYKEIQRRFTNSQKAERLLNFKTKFTLEFTIRQMIKAFRNDNSLSNSN